MGDMSDAQPQAQPLRFVCPECELRGNVVAKGKVSRPLPELAKTIRCPNCRFQDAEVFEALSAGSKGPIGGAAGAVAGLAIGTGVTMLFLPVYFAVAAGVVLAVILGLVGFMALKGRTVDQDLEQVALEKVFKPSRTVEKGSVSLLSGSRVTSESEKVLEAVHAVAATPWGVFAACDDGVLARSDAGIWDLEHPTSEKLKVVGPGPGALFAAGAYVIMRRNEQGVWEKDVPRGHEGSYDALYTDGHDVWAAGWYGAIVRRDGPQQWTPEDSGVSGRVRGIHGNGDEIWACTDRGEVLQRQIGGSWEKVPVPADGRFNAVHVGPESVWVVGDNGVALRKKGNSWQRVSLPFTKTPHLMAVFRSGEFTYVAGTGGALCRFPERGSGEKIAMPEETTVHGASVTPEGTVFLVGQRTWERKALRD